MRGGDDHEPSVGQILRHEFAHLQFEQAAIRMEQEFGMNFRRHYRDRRPAA